MGTNRMLQTLALAVACTLAAAGVASAQSAKKVTATQSANDAKLRAEAKVTETAARETALKQVPTGKIQSGEIERENGKLIYSFDIKVPGKTGIEEVNVDAMTGALVAHEHETPKAEKKEAAQEAKEKKHHKKA